MVPPDARADDALLDLSSWPARAPERAVPDPPAPVLRPVRTRRRLPTPSLVPACLAGLLLGGLLVAAPVPGCGPGAVAILRTTEPVPSESQPVLDDAQLRADAQAVAAAEAAASTAPAPRPTTSTRPGPVRTVTSLRTVPSPDPQAVAAAQDELDDATADVRAAKAEHDRAVARQEASSDPGAYDGEVAAAQEELEAALARQAEAQRALSVARARTVTVRVTSTLRGTPVPVPVATPTTDRAALAAAVVEARRVQAAHLAERQQALAGSREQLAARRAAVLSVNAEVVACRGRSAVPVSAGASLLVVSAGLLARRRLLG